MLSNTTNSVKKLSFVKHTMHSVFFNHGVLRRMKGKKIFFFKLTFYRKNSIPAILKAKVAYCEVILRFHAHERDDIFTMPSNLRQGTSKTAT